MLRAGSLMLSFKGLYTVPKPVMLVINFSKLATFFACPVLIVYDMILELMFYNKPINAN